MMEIYPHWDYSTMARKRQNITIIGREANRRIERAIPKIQADLGYGKSQATAVAIRLESVGQLGMGGRVETAQQKKSGKLSLGAFAVAQLQRKRQPKRTIQITQDPLPTSSVGEYQRQYLLTNPLMFTTNKKKPKKK